MYTWSNTASIGFKPEAWNTATDLSKGSGMAFPWMAAATIGSSIGSSIFGAIGARNAANTQANIANAQMKAAADQLKNQVLLSRDMAKFQMGGEIGSRVAQGTWMPDIDFGRQMAAKRFEAGPLGEQQLALGMQEARQRLGLEGSAEAKEASQRENRQRLKEALAQREGALSGMFGRIVRRNVDELFV